MGTVVAVDAGTTGVRALLVDETGEVLDVAYRELQQHYPRPGWVEHDAEEIWLLVVATLDELLSRRPARPEALGITNQRETVVAWDRRSGRPLHPAIVWQDRRTAARCQELVELGYLPLVRERTGLVIDPYFSATKMEWLLTHGGLAAGPGLALGTVDSWVLWNLTGRSAGVFATDVTNASRTLLYDIDEGGWSEDLCACFGIPRGVLAEVKPSCGPLGTVATIPALDGVPVTGMAGDQQAALFGQACFEPGMVKATYGTGSFVLAQAGTTRPLDADGLLTTVAWDLGAPGSGRCYALEGSTFVSGAAIQWLRDGLGIIDAANELGPLAASVDDSGGVSVVPAFTGLGSPWWDPGARGTILGLTRGSGRPQLARAVVESIAFGVRAMVDAMAAAGLPPTVLRADGGAAVMDVLLQLQADQLGVPVARPIGIESTALGAAYLAGLGAGVWADVDEIAQLWTLERQFEPGTPREAADAAYDRWLRTVERSRGWAER